VLKAGQSCRRPLARGYIFACFISWQKIRVHPWPVMSLLYFTGPCESVVNQLLHFPRLVLCNPCLSLVSASFALRPKIRVHSRNSRKKVQRPLPFPSFRVVRISWFKNLCAPLRPPRLCVEMPAHRVHPHSAVVLRWTGPCSSACRAVTR
jgi:hypothetical protein